LEKSAYDLRDAVPGGQKNELSKWFALNLGQYFIINKWLIVWWCGIIFVTLPA